LKRNRTFSVLKKRNADRPADFCHDTARRVLVRAGAGVAAGSTKMGADT